MTFVEIKKNCFINPETGIVIDYVRSSVYVFSIHGSIDTAICLNCSTEYVLDRLATCVDRIDEKE